MAATRHQDGWTQETATGTLGRLAERIAHWAPFRHLREGQMSNVITDARARALSADSTGHGGQPPGCRYVWAVRYG